MIQVETSAPMKFELSYRIRRQLLKGETIYHSSLPCHVSRKFPEGKWIAQVRREERGKLVKFPVKGFGTAKDALTYVVSLRPNAKGHVSVAKQGEPTIAMLFEYVTRHRQKRIGELTKRGKASRWRMYIEPAWGDFPISSVTKRLAQEWITELETKIENNEAGTLGFAQLESIRTDLHSLFESVGSFSSDYEDRKNPFAGLEFQPRIPRAKVTIESEHFAAVYNACQYFVSDGICTDWIAEMFLTSLLSGLREGEVIALCVDQIDFKNGAITVDRALRRDSREIDPKTRLEYGSVCKQAVNFPKKGTAVNSKTRIVPMSDQLAQILRQAINRPRTNSGNWDFIWPSSNGKLRQISRFANSWNTLRERLNETAVHAPLDQDCDWPEMPKGRGRKQNKLILEARENSQLRLPDIFGDIDFRDTRSSFGSFINQLGISQATREHILGHAGGLTNTVYTVVTTREFQAVRRKLSGGWFFNDKSRCY